MENETSVRTAADSALQAALDTHKNDKTNPHGITKTQVGLGNADNTADLDKPISTATQAALEAEASARGTADTELQNRIEQEARDRTAADTELQKELTQEIDAETRARKADTKALSAALNAETEERERVDREMWDTIDRKFAAVFPGGGTGTEDDPYVILSRDDLERVRDDLSAHYIVQGAIYLNAPWVPIGEEQVPFTGVFDGNGYTIRNLTITQGVGISGYAGLFASNEGTIKNLRLENVNVSVSEGGAPQVAAVVGMNMHAGVISGTGVVSGSVSLKTDIAGNAAGITGTNYGVVKDSYNKADILATKGYAAGITAHNRGNATVENVYNTAEISAPEFASVVCENMNTAALKSSYNLFPVRTVQTVNSTSSVINSEAKTMAELKQQETFVGWDFENTWEINPGQFPTLRIAKGTDSEVNNLGLPNGSKEHPYKISGADEFKNIPKDLSGNYILTRDIDLTGIEWTPAGTRTEPFTGGLDGKGHMITEFVVNTAIPGDGNSHMGLFAFNNGKISDLDLIVTEITDEGENAYVGALAAVNMENGVIERCGVRPKTVSVPIKSGNWIGGITAINRGKIENSYSQMRVESVNAGGIAGINEGSIEYTYSSDRITATGKVGGIVGENNRTVSNSYAYSHSSYTSAKEIVGDGNAAVDSQMVSANMLKKKNTYKGWDFNETWSILIDGAALPLLKRTSVQQASAEAQVAALAGEVSELSNTVDMLTAAILEG